MALTPPSRSAVLPAASPHAVRALHTPPPQILQESACWSPARVELGMMGRARPFPEPRVHKQEGRSERLFCWPLQQSHRGGGGFCDVHQPPLPENLGGAFPKLSCQAKSFLHRKRQVVPGPKATCGRARGFFCSLRPACHIWKAPYKKGFAVSPFMFALCSLLPPASRGEGCCCGQPLPPTPPPPHAALGGQRGHVLGIAELKRCPGNMATFFAIMLFLNSLLFLLFLLLFLPVSFLSLSLPFFFWFCLLVFGPPGSSAKKQGEDLADNDGDEDEGI